MIVFNCAFTGLNAAHYPHRPKAAVCVKAHGIAAGPAGAPTFLFNHKVRRISGWVDWAAVLRDVAHSDNPQLFFNYLKRSGTGKYQRPLARNRADIGHDGWLVQCVVVGRGLIAYWVIAPVWAAGVPCFLGKPAVEP